MTIGHCKCRWDYRYIDLCPHGWRELDPAGKNVSAKRNAVLDTMTLGGIQASWVEIVDWRFSRNRTLKVRIFAIS